MITVKGDTFESLSRRAYGSPSGAAQLQKANPGITTPTPPGLTIYVPPKIGAVADKSPGTQAGDVTVKIGGRKLTNWTKITITLSIDSPPAAQIEASWDPEREELRRTLRPFSFNEAVIFLGEKRLLTGYILPGTPAITEDGSLITIPAHGKTAAFADCTPPASALPLAFDDQTIDRIAATIAEPFGVAVNVNGSPGAAFDRVEMQTGDMIGPFLTKLAQQRGLIVGETSDGALLFTQADSAGAAVAALSDGASPVVSIQARFSATNYYSHITAIAPTIVGLKGEQVTVRNPFTLAALRPYTFEADDSKNETLQQIAEAKAGRMFANMVSWAAEVATWVRPDGQVWQPGDLVTLDAPSVMIYKVTRLQVRSVSLHQDRESRTATLELVIPGTFAGKAPEALPWEE